LLNTIETNFVFVTGKYTSDDVAASLALSFCTQMAKLVVLNARQENVTSVLFSGSILSEPIIKEYFETSFIEASLLLPLCGVSIDSNKNE